MLPFIWIWKFEKKFFFEISGKGNGENHLMPKMHHYFKHLSLPIPWTYCYSSHNLVYLFTGWGFQEESGSFSSKLREIHVPIIPIVICNSILHYFGRVDPLSMLCAGSGGADACQVSFLFLFSGQEYLKTENEIK